MCFLCNDNSVKFRKGVGPMGRFAENEYSNKSILEVYL